MMKKTGIILALLLCLANTAPCLEQSNIESNIQFSIQGPPVAESLCFAVMADRNMAGPNVEFIPWNSPDQARAMIAAGKIQGAVISTAAAAVLFNKGVKMRIAGVFSPPLWIISAAPVPKGPLAGTLLFPFGPGEMPELLFKTVMADTRTCKNLTISYTGGALEAVNVLLLGRADHALLAEPAATLAVARSHAGTGKGITLCKSLDMRRLWEEKFNGRAMCVSVFAVFGRAIAQPGRVKQILAGYGNALEWMKDHPDKALAIAKEKAPALAAQVNTLPRTAQPILTGKDAFSSICFVLEKIYGLDPGAVGGKLPGKGLFMEVTTCRSATKNESNSVVY